MKRILLTAAVMLFCLMLTACVKSDLNENSQNENEKQFMLGKLPDTDRYKFKETRKYFYDAGEKYEFEPNESYFKIVPYMCSKKEYTAPSGEKYDRNMYGISTFDGKIITAGIYSEVFEITSKDLNTVFICEKSSDNENIVKKDVITQDGAILIEAQFNINNDNGILYFSGMPCECLMITTSDGALLYDFKGKLIVNLTEAFGADCYFKVYYCDGEKIIFTAATDYSEYQQQNDLALYCMNREGELAYTLNFDGYFPTGFEGGHFILINSEGDEKLSDVSGNIVTGDKTYRDIIYDCENKGYWCYDGNGNILKTDENFEEGFSKSVKKIKNPTIDVLVSPDTSSLFIQNENKHTEFVWLSGVDGKKIKIDKKGLIDVELIFDGKNDYVKALYDGYADFYNAEGTYLKTVKEFKAFKGSCSGKILYLNNDNCLCINGLNVTQSFKLPLSEEQVKNYYIAYFSDEILAISFLIGDETVTTVYDVAKEEPIIENISDFCLFTSSKNTFYTGKANGKYILADDNGNVLISRIDKTYL